MSRRRLAMLVLLALSVAVLMLLANLPAVLERVAVAKLEGIGAKQISLKFSDVGLHTTRLAKLEFVVERNARRYTVTSRDIDMSYAVSDLLTGKIDTLTVAEIAVVVEDLPGGEVSSQEALAETRLSLPTVGLARVPFKAFQLGSLKLAVPAGNGRVHNINANGMMTIQQTSAKARFDIQANDASTQRLELQLLTTGMSRLVVSDMHTAATPLTYITLTSGAWQSGGGQLQADVGIDLDLQQLQQQLQRWGMHVIPAGTRGRLTARGPLRLPSNGVPSWQPRGTLALQLPNVDKLGKQLLLDAPLELAVTTEQLQWRVGKGSQLSVQKVTFNETRIPSVALKLATPASCDYQLGRGDWSCEAFALALTVPVINNKQTRVTTSTGKLELTSLGGSGHAWGASLAVDMPAWVITLGQAESAKQLKLDRLHGSIDASNENITARLALVAPRGGAALHINAAHVMKSNTGQARYRLPPVDMQLHASVFADSYSDWPAGLVLNAGSIELVGDVSWQQGVVLPSHKATLTLKNIGGAHNEITFAGLAATLDASGFDELQIKARQAVKLASLDTGTPITDISVQADMLWPQAGSPRLRFADLAMHVLGGKMSSQRIELDLGREQNPFSLQVSGVDVQELLKLEEKQGLFGTGIIDGELPLLLTAEGISMQKGQLVARKPGGKLRYSANEGVHSMAKTNPSVQLLLTAMKDFSYEVLEADVDYSPDGLLKMKVRLEGSNPELEGGRPVHLNVTVEDNILQLLRSLRLASEIGGKIGEQLQRRQLGK